MAVNFDDLPDHLKEKEIDRGFTDQFYNRDGTVKEDPGLKEEWKKRHDWYMEKGNGRFLSEEWRTCECHPKPDLTDPEVRRELGYH